jgi:hypothetical protein
MYGSSGTASALRSTLVNAFVAYVKAPVGLVGAFLWGLVKLLGF